MEEELKEECAALFDQVIALEAELASVQGAGEVRTEVEVEARGAGKEGHQEPGLQGRGVKHAHQSLIGNLCKLW